MAKYESSVKELAYSQHSVYRTLSDLSNLDRLRRRVNDPAMRGLYEGKVDSEKLDKALEQIENMEISADAVALQLPMVGEVRLRVVERTPDKCVKLETEKSPVPLTLWMQVVKHGEGGSKLRLTVEASVNPFMRAMIDKPLRQGVEKLADMLTMVPYDAVGQEGL